MHKLLLAPGFVDALTLNLALPQTQCPRTPGPAKQQPANLLPSLCHISRLENRKTTGHGSAARNLPPLTPCPTTCAAPAAITVHCLAVAC